MSRNHILDGQVGGEKRQGRRVMALGMVIAVGGLKMKDVVLFLGGGGFVRLV
jgi:hypothetical protein